MAGGCHRVFQQVTNREVNGNGGAAEQVGGGVGHLFTVRARGVLGSRYPLQVGLQGGAET